MAELKKEIMQHWNKGPADRTGTEILRPLILSLTESDQSHSKKKMYRTKWPYFCNVYLQGTDRVDDQFHWLQFRWWHFWHYKLPSWCLFYSGTKSHQPIQPLPLPHTHPCSTVAQMSAQYHILVLKVTHPCEQSTYITLQYNYSSIYHSDISLLY